ncbi:MAG TPA: hypothetical protein VMS02_09165 [Solirubrobacteraceae bacterium]|nr:hypothetical protein [Solirubrobacteraceae bacterium]
MPPSVNPISHCSSIPSDITLLLRTDAEQRWLHREVIPVLRELEAGDLANAGERVGAALAYLEDSWNEALLRARHTDAAREHGARDQGARALGRGSLGEDAVRYHTAVRALRGILAERVVAFVDAGEPQEPSCARIA